MFHLQDIGWQLGLVAGLAYAAVYILFLPTPALHACPNFKVIGIGGRASPLYNVPSTGERKSRMCSFFLVGEDSRTWTRDLLGTF